VCGRHHFATLQPGDAVTREEMGVFISATFALILFGP